MVTSVANVTGGIASLLLSALVLCFDVPHFVAPAAWAQPESTSPVCTRHKRSEGFHAAATIEDVGSGKEQLTVWLDFDGTTHHDEDEGL